jgi:SAM-dependent methyltransferase
VRSSCPACGGPLRGWRSVWAGEPGGGLIPLLKCVRCGTAVTAVPPPGAAHDSGAYATSRPRGSGLAAPLLALFDRQRLALVGDAQRLLDVGAGRGRFVAFARDAGRDASGVEPSVRGVEAARSVYGVSLQHGTLDDATGTFDAATLWHVLEHVEDPGAAMEALGRLVRPGGTLVVGVPNRLSLQARLARSRWFHFDAPRHRTHFTPAGLDTLLRAHGFAPVRTVHVLAEHNPFGMWVSLVPTRTPSFLYHLLKRNVRFSARDALVTALCLPLVPVAVVVELAAGLARRGGTIAVVAQRR